MDEADSSSRSQSVIESARLDSIRKKAADIPKGNPGVCIDCGLHFSRLVNGLCGICRDIRQGIRR